MRYCMRRLFIFFVRYLGILRLLRFIHRKRIIILTIHGVMDDSDGTLWKPLRQQLSPKKLEKYLRVLARRYKFVSLNDALEMIARRKPIQPYSLVLTFDDGYRNNLTHALPVLRRYGAPATFFICTGFVDNPRPFWWDRLDYALQQVRLNGREVQIGTHSILLDDSDRQALRRSYAQLRRVAKRWNVPDGKFLQRMEQLAAQLEEESGRSLADIQSEDNWSAIMTWEHIEELATADDVTFGSHTTFHIRPHCTKREAVWNEFLKSKNAIELHTGKPCTAICYPDGSFTNETVRLAKECNYLCGLTCESGANNVGDDMMRLRRINVPVQGSDSELLYHLARHTVRKGDVYDEL